MVFLRDKICVADVWRKRGERIKKARLRRNIGAEQLAEQAGIGRGTLVMIEKGAPSVSIGAYMASAFVLGAGKGFEPDCVG